MSGSLAAGARESLYGTDPSTLSFDSTIPRHLLHKLAVEGVFVTDSLAIGEDEFLCAAVLPRVNTPAARAVSQRLTRYDFATLFELLRQVSLVVTHQHLEIPASWSTVLFDMTLELIDVSATGPMTRPVTSITKVDIQRKFNKRGLLTRADFTMAIFFEDVLIARATAAGMIAQPEKYKAARSMGRSAVLARNPPPSPSVVPIDPALVGMRSGSSTAIGDLIAGPQPGHFSAPGRPDPEDLFYHDHPMDHVPGILSCEALRQASVVAACIALPELSPDETIVRRFEASLLGFIEPDIGLEVDVVLGQAGAGKHGTTVPVEGVLTQFGTRVVTARLELEFAKRAIDGP